MVRDLWLFYTVLWVRRHCVIVACFEHTLSLHFLLYLFTNCLVYEISITQFQSRHPFYHPSYAVVKQTCFIVLYMKFQSLDWNQGIHFIIVSKGAKIRNRYNQVPHLTQNTNGINDKLTEDTTNESQEVSPFPAGDHKAHINRRAQRHSKHKTEQKHKRSTKEVPPWNGQ